MNLNMVLSVCLSLRVLDAGSESPRLVRAEIGGKVVLGCDYELGGDSLYSIKWYREQTEFYRYLPRGTIKQCHD